MSVKSKRLKEAKNKSIATFLETSGISIRQHGDRYWCSSPFSNDSNWSFVVYPNNTFYDWANDIGGDIIDLVTRLENCSVSEAISYLLDKKLPTFIPKTVTLKPKKPFKLENYLLTENTERVDAYAKSRGITEYTAGKWMVQSNDTTFTEVPSLLFKHYDENLKLIGARFRTIENEREKLGRKLKRMIPRFNSRGELGWHILENKVENSYKPPVLYVMESETSATSLYQYFKERKIPAVILCFGGVNNKLLPIPKRFEALDRYLIIDYDGDEVKFNSRIEKIGLENATPIRLILEKGEDINSLYCRGEMYKISYLLK